MIAAIGSSAMVEDWRARSMSANRPSRTARPVRGVPETGHPTRAFEADMTARDPIRTYAEEQTIGSEGCPSSGCRGWKGRYPASPSREVR